MHWLILLGWWKVHPMLFGHAKHAYQVADANDVLMVSCWLMMDAHKDAHQIVPNVKEQLIITHHAQTKMLSLVTLFVEGALLMIARHVKKEMQHVQPATMTSRCTKAMHITMLQLKVHQHIAHHALVVNELNEISYECRETPGSSCIEGESCGCFNDYNE